MTAIGGRNDNKWKDFWTLTALPDKKKKNNNGSVSIVKLTRYSCRYCKVTHDWTSFNATKLNQHSKVCAKDAWNEWEGPRDQNQTTIDHYNAHRVFRKRQFPADHVLDYRQDVALRIIKGNHPFSQLDQDWFWEPENNMYVDPPRFGSRYFKNNLLKNMYNNTRKHIVVEVQRISQNRERNLSIMLDGYDCVVSKTKIVNFIIISSIFC